MMPTLRRLDDGTRYYHLTFRQWGAALAGLGLLYGAVRLSPLSHKWTFTIVLLTLSAITAVILPLTGNALGLDRYLAAIVRWGLGRRYFTALDVVDGVRGGVLLGHRPGRAHQPARRARGAVGARRRRAAHRGCGMNAASAVSARRTGSIAELIDIHALEPDGLIVTGAGEYVRVIECQFVPNPITADDSAVAAIEAGWAAVFAAIPDHQGLSLYAQTDPIPIEDAMAEDVDRVERAIADDLAAGRDDLARTRRRFLHAQTQSVATAAQGEQPAVAARYWVAVPWRPALPIKERFKAACTPPRPEYRTSWEAHQRAARESLDYTEQIAGLLAALGIDPHLLGPVEILAGLWERLHPAARTLPDFEALDQVARIVQATSPEEAAAHRREILDALCGGEEPCGHRRQRPALAASTPTAPSRRRCTSAPSRRRPRRGGSRTSSRCRCRAPSRSTSGSATARGPAWRSATAGGACAPRWTTRSAAASSSAARSTTRSRKPNSSTGSSRARSPRPSTRSRPTSPSASSTATRACSTSGSRRPPPRSSRLTDAKVLRGAFLNVQAWPTTLPIGVDPLRATRAYAQRNIAHCSPLVTAACGCPEGLILGFSDPGGTVVRGDPYDPKFQTFVTLIIGQGGGGKTMMVNKLLLAALSQGMRGFIIDRSTISGGDGGARVQGHYDPLLSLVPGSAKVHVGTGSGDVISPVGRRRPDRGRRRQARVPARVPRAADRQHHRRRAAPVRRRGGPADHGDRRRLSAVRRQRRAAPRDAARRGAPAARRGRHQPRQRRRHHPLPDRQAYAVYRGWPAGAHRRPPDDRRTRSAADAV